MKINAIILSAVGIIHNIRVFSPGHTIGSLDLRGGRVDLMVNEDGRVVRAWTG